MNRLSIVCYLTFITVLSAGTSNPGAGPNAAVDRLLDHIVEQETAFLERMKDCAPLIETYIQEVSPAATGDRPDRDHYFLGRFRLGDSINYEKLIEHTDAPVKTGSRLPMPHFGSKPQSVVFMPRGFAQMTVLDLHDFNRQTYGFDYI